MAAVDGGFVGSNVTTAEAAKTPTVTVIDDDVPTIDDSDIPF